MLKKLLPYIVFVVIAVPLAIFLIPKKSAEESPYQSRAMSVVPDDVVWILESRAVPDLLKALIQSDPLFPSLQNITSINQHLAAVRKIDSLITTSSRFKDFFTKNPVVVSLHQTGKNQYQFLMILETGGNPSATRAGDLFSDLCGRPGQWSQRTYNGQQINRIIFGVDALVQGISMAETKSFLIISPSPILLENAVRQMSMDTGLSKSRAFAKLSNTTGKSALASIYVNLKAVPSWMSGWMNPALKKKMEMFTRYGDWASLDLTVRNDAVWLNGFALEGDTLNSYLNLFKNQEAGKLEAEKYLPSSTAVYFSLGVEKPAQYLRALSDFLAGGEAGRKRQRALDKAVATGGNVVKVWSDLGFRELTIGYLCGVADETIRPVVLIETKSGRQVMEALVPDENAAGKKVFMVDTEHQYDIYLMPYENLPGILGGSFFTVVAGKYFSLLDNVVVLADDMPTLEEVLHKYTINKTLANDAVYLSFAGLISTRSNVTFFALPSKARPLLMGLLNPKSISLTFANDEFLLKAGAVGLQFHNSNGMSLHNFFASFAEIDYSKPQTIWESKLDARVAATPVIVTNHVTRDKEILVQDEVWNLYLINSSGRILWKKNIGERINSGIFQIDVLKNGRLQYLFSTPKAIHLLDRNGAWLPKYPVNLKLEATNGMALVDFDRTRDYRILIALSDNKVYAFDKGGNQIKGWNPVQATGEVTQPVQHFKIQNKDYLVFTDPVQVHILDRKGAAKVKPELDFAVSPNNRILYEPVASGKGARFLITDADGTVHALFMDGTVESKIFGEFSPDHYFSVEDFNQDGLSEYIFIDRNKFEVYSQAGEKLNSKKLSGNVTDPPAFYQVSGKFKKMGLTIPSEKQILLYNGDGSLYNGFPLYGQTPFTIGNLAKTTAYQNLLVGSDEAYLYNYAIK